MQLHKLDSYERISMSETTRILLCDFAVGLPTHPLHQFDTVDWQEVFQAVGRNGLYGLTYHYLRQNPTLTYPPLEFRQSIEHIYRASALNMVLMYRKINHVLSQLATFPIEYMVLKGPVLAQLVYPDQSWRPFNDLDILIRERDWAKMHQILLKLNFIPEYDLPYPPPKVIDEAVLYEVKYWHKENNLLVEVHYDDLLNAGLASRDIEGFWQRAISMDLDDVTIKALSMEDQLIHLCMHAHYHGYTRLNWFSDIAFLLRVFGDKLDWTRLLTTIRTEEAEVGVYYSLYFLEKLLGITVPAHVMAALQPDRFRQWWHEYYLPTPQVLSLKPMYRPDLSFYFRPLFKRLIPDLLIMGRRKEKIRYLLRLFYPPRDWLQHYYRLKKYPTSIHYLLHPLKIMYHYFKEMIGKVMVENNLVV